MRLPITVFAVLFAHMSNLLPYSVFKYSITTFRPLSIEETRFVFRASGARVTYFFRPSRYVIVFPENPNKDSPRDADDGFHSVCIQKKAFLQRLFNISLIYQKSASSGCCPLLPNGRI